MIGARAEGPLVERLLARSDFWRRSPASAGGPPGHKEWSYFCALGGEVDVIVNLSLTDRSPLAAGAPGRFEEARVTLLARTHDGRWHGDVDACDPGAVQVRAGSIDAQFGRCLLSFAGGAYHLDAQVGSQSRPVSVGLVLRQIARPAMARSVPLGPNAPMHWLVVPRLEATGEVRVGEDRYALRSAPAYHDHNWGSFPWGGDFAWEWAVALGGQTTPWSLVCYRITDRGRHRCISQGVLLWRDDRHCRTFRDSDLHVRGTGLLRVGRSLRVPRVMSLAIPGTAADIPHRLDVRASSGNDALEIELNLEDCAQIGLANDCDDGMTLISECRGRVKVSGCVRGEPVRFDGPSVVEFNRVA
jgi:hypothetical protein